MLSLMTWTRERVLRQQFNYESLLPNQGQSAKTTTVQPITAAARLGAHALAVCAARLGAHALAVCAARKQAGFLPAAVQPVMFVQHLLPCGFDSRICLYYNIFVNELRALPAN